MTKSLQQKHTRYLFARLLAVLLLGSIAFYFFMRMHAEHMQLKQLELRQRNLQSAFLLQQNTLMPFHITGEYDIAENGTLPPQQLGKPRDTLVFYPAENKSLPFAILTRAFDANGRHYQLTTYVSSTEIDHLIMKVFGTEAFLFGLLFVVIIYINYKTSGVLWKPFRNTLQKLREYDITKQQPVELGADTGTREFDELNEVAAQLIKKNRQAYHQQKQFVENASHEIQTPLAIIRSKLELLIDQPNITEQVAALLADITEANDRLSQMNRNLLLLAKIENNQFPETAAVNVSVLMEKIIAVYRQHYSGEFPEIETAIQPDLLINCNASLIEILLNNLVKNAVVHNIPGGYIKVELTGDCLRIANSGQPQAIASERIFERFGKGTDETRSTGLGLALVKQVCQLYNWKVDYTYQNAVHTITVMFSAT